MKSRGGNQVIADACIDGLVIRDLQLSDLAKHSYVLRPLPARTKRIYSDIVRARREVLGVKEPSNERQKWGLAVSRIMLRKSVSSAEMPNELHHLPDPSAVSTMGPQIIINYASNENILRPNTGSDTAVLTVELGQLLAYLRIKQQASLASFLSQMKTVYEATASSEQETQGTRPKSSYQTGLRVDLNMMGIDIVGRVQSRDLLLLRLQQGHVCIDRKAVSKFSKPQDLSLHISSSVDSVSLFDIEV